MEIFSFNSSALLQESTMLQLEDTLNVSKVCTLVTFRNISTFKTLGTALGIMEPLRYNNASICAFSRPFVLHGTREIGAERFARFLPSPSLPQMIYGLQDGYSILISLKKIKKWKKEREKDQKLCAFLHFQSIYFFFLLAVHSFLYFKTKSISKCWNGVSYRFKWNTM